jgi:hypothetical protein
LKELEPSKGMLLARTYIDHTEEISGVVRKIGLEFEVRGDVLRLGSRLRAAVFKFLNYYYCTRAR